MFVIAPDHDLASVEDVVRKEAGWWVVRKYGLAGTKRRCVRNLRRGSGVEEEKGWVPRS
jgi:hypothetical protein